MSQDSDAPEPTLNGSRSDRGDSVNEKQPNKEQAAEVISPSNEKGQQAHDEDFKEGGLRGWATVAAAILLQTCGFGYTNAFGVYQDYYTRIYITNSSSSAVSWIGSVNAFLVIASGLWVGVLYDRGYFYFLLYGGCFLISFSLFMLSLTQPDHLYQNFLAQGIGLGLGSGMIFIPSMAVVSQYFTKKRALAMTFVAAGSSLGSIIHPIMLNNLFFPRLGFAGATRVSAGLVTVLLIIACLLIRPRITPTRRSVSMWKSVKRFSKEPPYVVVSVGMLFFTVGFYFPLFYLQLDAAKHGIDETFAFYALVIMNGSSLIGRVTPGFFANSLGVINMIAAASFGCTALIFAMVGLSSVASVVVIAILYGLMSGVFVSLQAPLIAVLTTDMSNLALGALIGPPIHGALLTSNFIWWRPAIAGGVFAFVGAMCFLSVLFLIRRSKQPEASA